MIVPAQYSPRIMKDCKFLKRHDTAIPPIKVMYVHKTTDASIGQMLERIEKTCSFPCPGNALPKHNSSIIARRNRQLSFSQITAIIVLL
jgi:hypothetical protein